jgi:hypothetical protein
MSFLDESPHFVGIFCFLNLQGTGVRYFSKSHNFHVQGELRSVILPISPEKRIMEDK